MKSAKLSLLLIAVLAAIFTTQAKLFTDKAVCVPSVLDGAVSLGKEGDRCDGLTLQCARPAECDLSSKTCKIQELLAGKTCSKNSDCYTVDSISSRMLVSGLKCLGNKCRWLRGIDDSCDVNLQCPLGVPCRNGVCSRRKGDACLPLVEDFTGACGSSMYCQYPSLTCQSLLDNNERCFYDRECKSGHCYDSKCIAEQRSEGGSCKRALLGVRDNCADGLYCSKDTNKCKSYAGVGDSCGNSLSKTEMCKRGLLCKDKKCIKPEDVPCAGQSDCGNVFRGVCMCKTGKCSATYDAFTCGAQFAKASACLAFKCRQVLGPYVFAAPDSCAKRKCGGELIDWHDCHKVVTKREYSVSDSYMGSASMARVSTMLLVVVSVIVSFFSL